MHFANISFAHTNTTKGKGWQISGCSTWQVYTRQHHAFCWSAIKSRYSGFVLLLLPFPSSEQSVNVPSEDFLDHTISILDPYCGKNVYILTKADWFGDGMRGWVRGMVEWKDNNALLTLWLLYLGFSIHVRFYTTHPSFGKMNSGDRSIWVTFNDIRPFASEMQKHVRMGTKTVECTKEYSASDWIAWYSPCSDFIILVNMTLYIFMRATWML